MTKEKNPAAVALGKLGGSKTSEAKRKASKKNWEKAVAARAKKVVTSQNEPCAK